MTNDNDNTCLSRHSFAVIISRDVFIGMLSEHFDRTVRRGDYGTQSLSLSQVWGKQTSAYFGGIAREMRFLSNVVCLLRLQHFVCVCLCLCVSLCVSLFATL